MYYNIKSVVNFEYFFFKNQLLNLSIHIGHDTKNWFYDATHYLFGVKNNIIIFNIDYILYSLKRIILVITEIIIKYGEPYIISPFYNYGYRSFCQYFIKKFRFNYYDGLYRGGLVSNFFVLKNLHSSITSSIFIKKTKNLFPSCVIICDSNEFYSCFKEALHIGIIPIGIIDSDLDSRISMYLLAGNNESIIIHIYFILLIYFKIKVSLFLRKKKLFLKCKKILVLYLRYLFYKKLLKKKKFFV